MSITVATLLRGAQPPFVATGLGGRSLGARVLRVGGGWRAALRGQDQGQGQGHGSSPFDFTSYSHIVLVGVQAVGALGPAKICFSIRNGP